MTTCSDVMVDSMGRKPRGEEIEAELMCPWQMSRTSKLSKNHVIISFSIRFPGNDQLAAAIIIILL